MKYLAQPARALLLHRRCHGFESPSTYMTHKISPIAFRLGVSSSWLSSSHLSSLNLPLILHSDLFIRTLIKGILLQFSLFTSPIILKRSPNGSLAIHLFFWDASSSFSPSINYSNFPLPFRSSFFHQLSLFKKNNWRFSKIKIVSNLIFLLLSKLYKLNTNAAQAPLTLHLSEIPSPVFNAKILCDYLAYRISLNPYYHKSVVMEALRASKINHIN